MEQRDLHPDARVIRHKKRVESEEESQGDGRLIEVVSEHFERHVGPIASVLHEIKSDRVHLDVHIINPTDDHPYITLFTTGMAELPMHAPEGYESFRFAELMIKLPADWPLEVGADNRDRPKHEIERWYWPVRLLKGLARLPHDYETWLFESHSVPNGDPPEPYADNTELCGALVIVPMMDSEDFDVVEVDADRRVHILQVLPIGPGEMDHKLRHGSDSLFELFDQMQVSDVVDPTRFDVTGHRPRRKRFFGLF